MSKRSVGWTIIKQFFEQFFGPLKYFLLYQLRENKTILQFHSCRKDMQEIPFFNKILFQFQALPLSLGELTIKNNYS